MLDYVTHYALIIAIYDGADWEVAAGVDIPKNATYQNYETNCIIFRVMQKEDSKPDLVRGKRFMSKPIGYLQTWYNINRSRITTIDEKRREEQ